jgi:hypothetical protein
MQKQTCSYYHNGHDHNKNGGILLCHCWLINLCIHWYLDNTQQENDLYILRGKEGYTLKNSFDI